MRKVLLAAALAFAPIPAHANYIEIVNGEVVQGIGWFHFTSGTFDLADPDWSFENDPNWRTEIVPCPLVPWIFGEYIAWETVYHPPSPPVEPPPVGPPPPCTDCGPPPPCLTCGPPTPTPIPEASTWAMTLIGFACIGFSIFRQRLATVSRE